MGALADKAREQSKFLILEKGKSALVRFVDFRFVPSQKDPSVDVVMYRVNEDGREKFWTNGSSAIMRMMDTTPKGAWIRITRASWINKDGTEDKSKSAYQVDEVDDKGKILRTSARDVQPAAESSV